MSALPTITSDPLISSADFILNDANRIDPFTVIDDYACLVKALESASKAAGLGEFWKEREAQFRTNIDKWRRCGDIQTFPGLV